MSFSIQVDELLNKIIKSGLKSRDKVWKKDFMVYNEKYLRTKIKSYKEKINANFYDSNLRKVLIILAYLYY